MDSTEWLQDLPEAYRDPAKIKEVLGKMPDLEKELAVHKEFYEKQYMPWLNEHGALYQDYTREADDYRRWKDGQGKAATGTDLAPSARQSSVALNFDDPDALEKAYHTMEEELGSLKTEISTLKTAQEAERNNVYQLIALQEQAYGLLNSELYQHLDWKPQTDIRQVATYARDHGLADLTEAATQLYRGTREKSIEQQAYERGKREGEQAVRNASITTEMGTGTPLPELRRARPEGMTTGYGNTNLDAMNRAIAERRAARRMATT